MSNGLTSVFITVLCLSASRLAKTGEEIGFALWLAEHDQAIVGSGTVGFDLSQMPWSVENFEAEKLFVLAVIDSARSKQDWDLLDYQPHEEWTLSALAQFQALVEDFTEAFVDPATYEDRLADKPEKLEKCSIHGIYLHWAGCVICNDK